MLWFKNVYIIPPENHHDLKWMQMVHRVDCVNKTTSHVIVDSLKGDDKSLLLLKFFDKVTGRFR